MSNHGVSVLSAVASTAFLSAALTPLAVLSGKSRVFVVSSVCKTDPALTLQNGWLRASEAGLHKRDVVVIRIVGNAIDAPRGVERDPNRLRQALGLPSDRFGVALIGKDGSEAFVGRQPTTMRFLFGAIDAMPMRKEEMQRPRP